jgi:NAD(P)-dependent dehydrogenase (short-subunit alcohol dehydrogenase family)
MTDDEFDGVIKAHVYGTFYVTRACASVMRNQRSGTVINIGSARSAWSGRTDHLRRRQRRRTRHDFAWAQELARYGITCNCVLPNALMTMTEGCRNFLLPTRTGRRESSTGLSALHPEVAPLVVLLTTPR